MCSHIHCPNTLFARLPRGLPLLIGALALAAAPAHAQEPAPAPETVLAHGNTRPAGVHHDGELTIRLRAARGAWQPEGAQGPALLIDAFGEEGDTLTVPAPLIRVREGTPLTVTVRNDLPAPLRVHGLCARDGESCAPLDVDSGQTRTVHFASGRAGTYHYWATSLGAPVPMREMAGALIVDPPHGVVAPERIFVITEWSTLTAADLADILAADAPGERFLAQRPAFTFVINGRSWPDTERLVYRRGEEVRWRVLNLSSQTHPMHLHGFYFTVLATGDGHRDVPVAGDTRQRVVTHLLTAGGTMTMTWVPEEEGNWLFHCHIMSHVAPSRRLTGGPRRVGDPPPDHSPAHVGHDPSLGMAGMVLGITVLPVDAPRVDARPATASRQLTMRIEPVVGQEGQQAIGVAFDEPAGRAKPVAARSPGPLVVLERGKTVEITIVNRLTEPTSIHWHGLELESYYDGVHGWSGRGARVAPMIAPGGNFVVRITPPRAGTFIYHTHLHDYRQLSSGLYGALIVKEPDETYDPETDHVVVLGRQHASEASAILLDPLSVVLNGDRSPRWIWRAGARHRIRIINITADDVLAVSAVTGDRALEWLVLAKDGAPVPVTDGSPVPAQLRIAVGETYDVELVTPPGRGSFWIEVGSPGGKWQAHGQVLLTDP